MALSTTASTEDFVRGPGLGGGFADNPRSLASAVSWGAIAAGAE